MSAWSHLPNAVHIDRVLASVKSHPKLWLHTRDQAWQQTNFNAWDQARDQARDQAWYQVWEQARGQAWEQARDQVRVRAWYQARDQVGVRARGQVWDQAWGQEGGQAMGAMLALVAYDDCATYLQLPIDQLKMLYQLNEHPACLLLQPAVIVFAKEKELVQS